jgi:hypothetical protein
MMLLGATLLAGPSAAQNAPLAPTADPKACAPQEQRQGTVGSSQTLSDKLERTDGVICPPAGIDSEITRSPPGAGKTPVIPPPGSPGGDPTVRPK